MASKGKYSYHIEAKALEVSDQPRKFLEAFAAVFKHGNYGLALFPKPIDKTGFLETVSQLLA